MTKLHTQADLLSACVALLNDFSDLTDAEKKLVSSASESPVTKASLNALRDAIGAGNDPLGEAFTSIHTAAVRRSQGAIYTPLPIVESMIGWIANESQPDRIVDPGAGSGRYILAAGRTFTNAALVAVEADPIAALMLRANVHAAGLAHRTQIIVDDYRNIDLPEIAGKTAFVGNPPYVRHHDIDEDWKKWYVAAFKKLGIRASALAGLHLHFFLQTRLLARPGDIGSFITSSEWMDVNYGSALRNLLVEGLGGVAIHVLEPTIEAFPGTQATAAITCFRIGETERPLRVRSVDSLPLLNGLSAGNEVDRATFLEAPRWSIIIRPSQPTHSGELELGEIFRVHRGQVTGANDIWIAGENAQLLPQSVLIPTVTKAKELIDAGEKLQSVAKLRRIVDIPAELDLFSKNERDQIEVFLNWAREQGGDQSYIARHRKAWWSVGLKEPAPILCTYMARRPPQFTVNSCGARNINIAHGLYPREPFATEIIEKIVAWLNKNINVAAGRTYSGGLTKFEPKEMERLRIPELNAFIE